MPKSIQHIFFSISLLASLVATAAQAAPSGEFDYPELMVTPRASERINSEAAKEPSTRWTTLIPHQISALTTLTAGIIQKSGDATTVKNLDSGMVGIAAGGALLATTFAIEAFYTPYASAAREIAAMPAKTPREQLIRERAAEEAIRSASNMAWRFKWLSVLANVGVNGYMATQAKSSTLPQTIDILAAAAAFAPVIFGNNAQNVYREQESYKKRIYAPIASLAVMREPGTGATVPGAAFRLSF
jgi:hypothetical protein